MRAFWTACAVPWPGGLPSRFIGNSAHQGIALAARALSSRSPVALGAATPLTRCLGTAALGAACGALGQEGLADACRTGL